jgi:hypothetical protein
MDDIPVVYLGGVMQIASSELTVEAEGVGSVIQSLKAKYVIDPQTLRGIRTTLEHLMPFRSVTFEIDSFRTGGGESVEVKFLRKEA